MLWKILAAFGLPSWLSDRLLKKSTEKPMTTDTETESSTEESDPKILVHRVTDGPFSSHEAELTSEEHGDPEFWWVEAIIEYDGMMHQMMITHDDFDKIYKIINHTKTHIEPYELGQD
jgi:hypothetical protein